MGLMSGQVRHLYAGGAAAVAAEAAAVAARRAVGGGRGAAAGPQAEAGGGVLRPAVPAPAQAARQHRAQRLQQPAV